MAEGASEKEIKKDIDEAKEEIKEELAPKGVPSEEGKEGKEKWSVQRIKTSNAPDVRESSNW